MVGICRLCASLRKVDLLDTITDTNNDICRKLHICCNVEISMDDPMPKTFCRDCIQCLHSAFVFYTKVHESQESLAMLFPAKTPSVADSLENCDIQPTLAESLKLAVRPQTTTKTETEVSGQPEEQQSEDFTIVDDATKENILVEVYEELDDQQNPNDVPLTKEDDSDIDTLIFNDFIKLKDTSSVYDENEATANSCHDNIDETELKINESTTDLHADAVDDKNLAEEYLDNLPFSVTTPLTEWSSYMWLCCLCDHTSNSFLALQEHTHLVHEAGDHTAQPTEMQYKCSDCKKTCTRYASFLNHVRQRHHPGLALCCDVCNERCADHRQLAMHRRRECAEAAASYPAVELCTECGKGFFNQNGMQLHLATQHSQIEKTFKCEHCDKQFKRLGTLRAHLKVHSDVKEFTCDLCGRDFRQRINLDVHLLSHIKDKPFECTICQKSFKTTITLEKHILIHNDVKKFKCDYCGNSFRTKDSKLSHERIHTGEMPFMCTYCEKRFRFRSTLMTHINLHTGERPYACPECDRTFTNWSNYNKHMKRMHPKADGEKDLKPKTNLKPSKTKNTTPGNEANSYYWYNDNGEMVETADEHAVYDEFMETSSVAEESQRGSPFEGFELLADST